MLTLVIYPCIFQLYEIDDNPKRREFLDELFAFMQKRGKKTFLFIIVPKYSAPDIIFPFPLSSYVHQALHIMPIKASNSNDEKF